MSDIVDKMAREEGWGLVTDAALKIAPSDVESQAREVARYCVKLTTENERLLAAMAKARDGLRWSKIHLQEAGMRSVSVEEGLDAAEAALERKEI